MTIKDMTIKVRGQDHATYSSVTYLVEFRSESSDRIQFANVPLRHIIHISLLDPLTTYAVFWST